MKNEKYTDEFFEGMECLYGAAVWVLDLACTVVFFPVMYPVSLLGRWRLARRARKAREQ